MALKVKLARLNSVRPGHGFEKNTGKILPKKNWVALKGN